MRSPVRQDSASREAENELYDRGCDLLEAASAIRRFAAAPQAVGAVPALLGCIEAAISELTAASALLDDLTASSIEGRGVGDEAMTRRVKRMERGWANLRAALGDAAAASGAARALVARVTVRLQ